MKTTCFDIIGIQNKSEKFLLLHFHGKIMVSIYVPLFSCAPQSATQINIYLFKVNSRNTRKRNIFKIHNKNTRTMSLMASEFFHNFFKVSIVDFEQVNVGWDKLNNYTKKHFCHKFLKKPKPTSSDNIFKILNWLKKAKYVYNTYQNGWVVSFIPGKAILPLKTHSRASDHIWQLRAL